MKLVLVTGSREWSDKWKIHNALTREQPDVIIEGEQRGADLLSRAWGDKYGVSIIGVPALWAAHGKGAGPKRNRFMLKTAIALQTEWAATLEVVAFPMPNSVGTWDMVEICKKAGRKVTVIDPSA